jgi:EAL domain-containing protein (putative c-di-GMP-specific phosphodiesterase class I)/CheY-like chemotaxis protein/GGDEF domain-containing protein
MDSVALRTADAVGGAGKDDLRKLAWQGAAAPPAASELAGNEGALGLRGRSGFLHEIEAAIGSARGQLRQFAVLAISVPADEAAAAAPASELADRLALIIAARLGIACDDSEVPARIDGRYFAVRLALLPAGAATVAHRRAQALQAVLSAAVWFRGVEVFPQPQLGVAVYPEDGERSTDLLDRAQRAALGAAAQGGIGFFGTAANTPVLREWQLAEALQHAVERDELRLLYQPKVSLDSGQIVGVEALLRWRPADFGEVSPKEFIPLAERGGQIERIGGWALRQACWQSVTWRKAGLRPLRIAVNISPIQFRLADLARQVQAALIETGADPNCLAIELTETSLMADVERARTALRELKALGVEISLDDFGTGSSSLGVLQRLPIDVVNIDRSFVHDVTASPESVSMTRAIITMAHGMKLRVLAEGVETDGQLGLLAANGCDEIQGHGFSPAVPADQVEALLREERTLPPRFLRRRVQQRTLLLVDDDNHIVSSLKRLLRGDGYRILTASGGEEGLLRLAEHAVDVIVSDQRMPGMSGVEFLRRTKALYPDTVRITLSGFTELQSIIDAVNEGAIYKFLTKPWDDELLRRHIKEAFRQKEMADENRRLSIQVAHANAELEALSVRLAALLEAQREQSEQLAASASGAREMLDDLPVAVIGIDPDDVVAYVNRAASRLLPQAQGAMGCTAGDIFPVLLGRPLPAVGPPVRLRLGGRGYQALTQSLDDAACPAQGRGRLVLLVEDADQEAA